MSENLETENPLSVRPKDVRRYDGSIWREFDFNNGSKLILTSRGTELLSFNPELRKLLRKYEQEASQAPVSDPSHKTRKIFRQVTNSTVYSLGETELLVKEGYKEARPSLEISLDRMDYLYGVCMRYLYPNVRVPDHYGLFMPANSDREYLLMRKINNGVTVQDIVKGRVPVDPAIRQEVEADFNALKPKVLAATRQASQHIKIPFRTLLADWSDTNVLADFTTKSGGKPYTLWIIDQ